MLRPVSRVTVPAENMGGCQTLGNVATGEIDQESVEAVSEAGICSAQHDRPPRSRRLALVGRVWLELRLWPAGKLMDIAEQVSPNCQERRTN